MKEMDDARTYLKNVESCPKLNGTLMRFREDAYSRMISLKGIEFSDCSDTVRDIKMIFHQVAEHELNKHNQQVIVHNKKHEIPEADMPGIDPGKIKFCEISKCLLPTCFISKDGTIRINKNFVKLIYKLWLDGTNGSLGYIYDADRNTIIGELYTSLLHALALYAVRGCFAINEWGFPIFKNDSPLTQGDRGHKYLYINTLAMSYYWIMLVERHKYPMERLELYMKKYPNVYRNLSASDRRKMPSHLLQICSSQIDRNVFPFPQYIDDTGTSQTEVEQLLLLNPESVTNEGYMLAS